MPEPHSYMRWPRLKKDVNGSLVAPEPFVFAMEVSGKRQKWTKAKLNKWPKTVQLFVDRFNSKVNANTTDDSSDEESYADVTTDDLVLRGSKWDQRQFMIFRVLQADSNLGHAPDFARKLLSVCCAPQIPEKLERELRLFNTRTELLGQSRFEIA